MSSFNTNDVSLPDILKQITSGKIQLPEFQRGWIWDDRHIKELLISVAKSFPIGAIMLLETGGNFKFQTRPIEGVKLDENCELPNQLILDGQQRLTTLTQALTSKFPVKTKNEKNAEIERYYYFDINKALEENKLEEAIFTVNSERQLKSNFGRDLVLDLSTVEKECEAFCFPCNQILDSDEWEQILHMNFENKFADYLLFRKKILEKFRRYKIPAIILENETEKEAICLVFEKVNTGGVPLSVSDLVTASFAAENFNLRKDWYGHEDGEVIGKLKILQNEATLAEVELSEFLQAVSLLTTVEQRNKDIDDGKIGNLISAVSATKVSVLSLSLNDYLNWQDDLISGFLLVAKFLRKQCIFTVRDRPYQTQLVPLAATLAKLKDKWLEPKVYKKIHNLFWCGVLGELYSGPVETRMANDLEDLLNWIEDDTREPRTILNANFDPDRLYTLKTRTSAAYKGIYALILKEGAQDFFWKASVEELDFEDVQIDIHHIFPKKWCQANKISPSEYDSIINKTPISYKANRIIGGDAPSIYLRKLQEKANLKIEDMDSLLISHGIDPVSVRKDDFCSFFEQRKKFLLTIIRNNMGNSRIKEYARNLI